MSVGSVFMRFRMLSMVCELITLDEADNAINDEQACISGCKPGLRPIRPTRTYARPVRTGTAYWPLIGGFTHRNVSGPIKFHRRQSGTAAMRHSHVSFNTAAAELSKYGLTLMHRSCCLSKEYHTPCGVLVGCSSPLLRP